jgi:predicted nucleic acid-binding protein
VVKGVSSFRETSSSPPLRALRGSTSRNSEQTSMPSPILRLGVGRTGRHGLIDTSVAIALKTIDRERLPRRIVVSALTIAELAGGPHGSKHDLQRVRRENQLKDVRTKVEALDFDLGCAHAYGMVYGASIGVGRKPRGARAVDLMIAATALAHRLPLYTLNPKDLRGLDDLIEIVDVGSKTGR